MTRQLELTTQALSSFYDYSSITLSLADHNKQINGRINLNNESIYYPYPHLSPTRKFVELVENAGFERDHHEVKKFLTNPNDDLLTKSSSLREKILETEPPKNPFQCCDISFNNLTPLHFHGDLDGNQKEMLFKIISLGLDAFAHDLPDDGYWQKIFYRTTAIAAVLLKDHLPPEVFERLSEASNNEQIIESIHLIAHKVLDFFEKYIRQKNEHNHDSIHHHHSDEYNHQKIKNTEKEGITELTWEERFTFLISSLIEAAKNIDHPLIQEEFNQLAQGKYLGEINFDNNNEQLIELNKNLTLIFQETLKKLRKKEPNLKENQLIMLLAQLHRVYLSTDIINILTQEATPENAVIILAYELEILTRPYTTTLSDIDKRILAEAEKLHRKGVYFVSLNFSHNTKYHMQMIPVKDKFGRPIVDLNGKPVMKIDLCAHSHQADKTLQEIAQKIQKYAVEKSITQKSVFPFSHRPIFLTRLREINPSSEKEISTANHSRHSERQTLKEMPRTNKKHSFQTIKPNRPPRRLPTLKLIMSRMSERCPKKESHQSEIRKQVTEPPTSKGWMKKDMPKSQLLSQLKYRKQTPILANEKSHLKSPNKNSSKDTKNNPQIYSRNNFKDDFPKRQLINPPISFINTPVLPRRNKTSNYNEIGLALRRAIQTKKATNQHLGKILTTLERKESKQKSSHSNRSSHANHLKTKKQQQSHSQQTNNLIINFRRSKTQRSKILTHSTTHSALALALPPNTDYLNLDNPIEAARVIKRKLTSKFPKTPLRIIIKYHSQCGVHSFVPLPEIINSVLNEIENNQIKYNQYNNERIIVYIGLSRNRRHKINPIIGVGKTRQEAREDFRNKLR